MRKVKEVKLWPNAKGSYPLFNISTIRIIDTKLPTKLRASQGARVVSSDPESIKKLTYPDTPWSLLTLGSLIGSRTKGRGPVLGFPGIRLKKPGITRDPHCGASGRNGRPVQAHPAKIDVQCKLALDLVLRSLPEQ